MPFWDELYGDNHWRRLVLGRHGDRGTFEYFLRELGYARACPGSRWRRRRWARRRSADAGAACGSDAAETRRQGIYWFGAIWFVAAYALVSLSVTKFHHYILPAIPGLAIVIGCFLDDLLSRRDSRAAAGAAALVGMPLLALVAARPGAAHRRTRSTSSGCSRTTTSTARRDGPGRPRSTSARR